MKIEIFINQGIHESRIAIVEDGTLAEIWIERPESERMVGDIYLGKVNAVLPSLQAAFVNIGLERTYRAYGAELEVFVEKRFGKKFTIRAVGSNLLNGAKRETFNKFDNLADQVDRNFDEYELESEKAGPVFQLIARMAF